MALDPANPPIWLRKLHVSARQISPTDYAPTPEEGILIGCRWSDEMHEFSQACRKAMGFPPLGPPDPPFTNPFQNLRETAFPASGSRAPRGR